MKRKKLEELLGVVWEEAKKAEKRYKKNKSASEQTQASSRTSWSAAGERDYAQGQVEVSLQLWESFKNLGKELEKVVDIAVPEKVISPCFLRLEPDDKKCLFVVENVVSISGYNLISNKSPMGKALKGKKIGDKYILSIEGGMEKRGVVTKIG